MIHKTLLIRFSIMWSCILLRGSVTREMLLAIICRAACVGMKFQLDILCESWDLVGLRSVWLFKVCLYFVLQDAIENRLDSKDWPYCSRCPPTWNGSGAVR